MAFQLTDDNFAEQKVNNNIVVVDFWATWCGPCRMVSPIIEDLAVEYDGRALVGKVDVDVNRNVAREYGVRSIPTIVILKNGKVFEKHVGTITKANLQGKIEAALA